MARLLICYCIPHPTRLVRCWIREGSQWARLVFYYVPLVLVFLFSTSVYALTRRHLLALHMAARGSSRDTSDASIRGQVGSGW